MSDSVLDLEFLGELLDGDAEFAEELFETYYESADKALDEARKMISAGDTTNCFRPFHTLKGASASVGLTTLQELARKFEVTAKAGELGKCEVELPKLEAAIGDAKSVLKAYLQTLT